MQVNKMQISYRVQVQPMCCEQVTESEQIFGL